MIIESLKEELESTCSNFNLKIEKLEQKLADVDQSRPVNHSTKKGIQRIRTLCANVIFVVRS